MTARPVLRRVLTSTRVVAGAVAAVAAVGAVVVGIALPWPGTSVDAVRITATAPPADTELACSGALLALGRTVERAGSLSVAAAEAVVSGAPGASIEQGALAGPTDESPAVFTATPDASGSATAAAAGSASVEAADLRGFAASACRPALAESWLVGGATSTGANDLLVLSNPGSVPATVDVTVYGASGPESAPGGSNRVVPAGTQVVVPLAGLLPAEQSPVVRVTTSGAPVSASLQSSLVRVLTPVGIDRVSALAAPAQSLQIPGVTAAGLGDGQGAGTIVRMLAPTSDTQARVTVRDGAGQVVGTPATVPLTSGVPTELELTGLAAGTYTVAVDADAPVVAGVWSTTGFDDGADFAWYAAAPALERPTSFAAASGPGARLVVSGVEGSATVTLTAPDGTSRQVEASAGGATAVELAQTGVYTLEPSSAVTAAVVYAGTGALAGYPVWGPDAAAPPITVVP
ncbi:DUF5719 family protein [Microbacterium sp. NPDC091313]